MADADKDRVATMKASLPPMPKQAKPAAEAKADKVPRAKSAYMVCIHQSMPAKFSSQVANDAVKQCCSFAQRESSIVTTLAVCPFQQNELRKCIGKHASPLHNHAQLRQVCAALHATDSACMMQHMHPEAVLQVMCKEMHTWYAECSCSVMPSVKTSRQPTLVLALGRQANCWQLPGSSAPQKTRHNTRSKARSAIAAAFAACYHCRHYDAGFLAGGH